MRIPTLTLLSAVGLAGFVAAASAAPVIPAAALPGNSNPEASNIEQIAGGCGWGAHRFRGHCVRNHYYRPYAYSYRVYPRYRYERPYYRPFPYYGGGYEPWNRPSPSDHVANQLNARELGRGGYWGY